MYAVVAVLSHLTHSPLVADYEERRNEYILPLRRNFPVPKGTTQISCGTRTMLR